MQAKARSDRPDTVRGRQIANYVAGTARREFPAEVIDAAKKALLDFIGVAVGAARDECVRPVRRVVESWATPGNARMFLGGCTTPALAALVNGTMGHAMDYDDTHTMGAGHLGTPCWSAALALAGHRGDTEQQAIAAFVTGFEVMARLGGGGPPGVGRSLHRRGFHPTSVLGRIGAAAVAGAILELDETRIEHAMGVAATTASGLVGSFGTHAKPFHAGKAAMDGILAAQLAAEGFVAARHLFELEKGMLDSFIQDGVVEVPPLDFEARWELLRNGFKPFASCRATHASSQAARTLAPMVVGKSITRVHARVHPNALITAGKRNPTTPLEGKFSVPFCVSLGLRGYSLVATDFSATTINDASVREIVPVVELEAVEGQPQWESHLDVWVEGGQHLHADVDFFVGHPNNPMTWNALEVKFRGLVEPILGNQKASDLCALLRQFEQAGSLRKVMAMLAGPAPGAT